MSRKFEHLSGGDLFDYLPSIVDLFAVTMLASELFQVEISKEATQERLKRELEMGMQATVAREEYKLVGVTTYSELDLDTESPHEMLSFKHKEIMRCLKSLGKTHHISDFAFLSRTFVDPDCQGKGVAKEMRQQTLARLKEDHPDGVIVFTNHQSNNTRIIRSSISLGFKQTGIKQTWQAIEGASAGEYLNNEYWYLVLK